MDDPTSIAQDVADRLSAARRHLPSRPTWLETQTEKNREQLRQICKYPLREPAILSPEQLAATRAGLGAAGLYLPGQWGDHRPLTSDELHRARSDVGMTGWERD